MLINDSKSTSSAVISQTTKASQVWIVLLIMILALVGHTLVFVAFHRERNLRTLLNIIIINLSVADFLFSAIVPSTNVVRLFRKEETLDESQCYITGIASMLFCLVSINTLTFISIERFLATNYPLKHRHYFDLKLVKAALTVIWCWSALLSVFPFFTTKYVFLRKFFHCSADWAKDLSTTLTLAILCIGSPLAILVYCNFHIVLALRKSRYIQTSQLVNSNTSNSRHQRERQMSILTITVVVTFAICWAPYCAGMLCLAHKNCGFSGNFMLIALILSTLNSCCNPVIYGLLNKNFRNAFKNILRCQSTRVSPRNALTTGTT